MSTFLLEIGVENLPASYIEPAVAQLRDAVAALLDEERIAHGAVTASGSPRRLAVTVADVGEKQSAGEELVTGPPIARAYDESGNPTKAAEGFARGQGVAVSALETVDTDKGPYLGIRRRLKRRATSAILRDALPALIAALRFPKSMKWESSGARFARPVRWIVCMMDSKVVKFGFADVTSGNRTWGRPWMKGESAVLRSASGYAKTLERLGVIGGAETRRQRIEAQAERAAAREKLRVIEDEDLVIELSQMTENPRALVGTFPDAYLELPREVVTTAMRSHQRYLALETIRGKALAPKFITFTDHAVGSPAEVRSGNEKVLRARLDDARFYWREDTGRGVDGLAAGLDRIVFIEGLGSLGEKSKRVERVAVDVNARLSKPAAEAVVRRAAAIAKADLASEMIKDGKEFTKLQGVMGARYAEAGGEPAEVVAAIREQYEPRAPGDPLPASSAGAALGVADRLDTICGCFIAGFKPTGSQDPYALRRQANGLVRIIDAEEGVALDEILDSAMNGYGERGTGDIRAELTEFLIARVETYLKDGGVPYDVAAAVVPVTWTRPGLALRRARAIAAMRGNAVFERLITGVKRVGNILGEDRRVLGATAVDVTGAVEGRAAAGFSEDRFEDDSERALLTAVKEALPAIQNKEGAGDFDGVLAILSRLADPIDRFFDSVLVNAEDADVRENRHAFLASVYAVFGRFADFSRIVDAD